MASRNHISRNPQRRHRIFEPPISRMCILTGGFSDTLAGLRRTMTVISQIETWMVELRKNEDVYWSERSDLTQDSFDGAVNDVQNAVELWISACAERGEDISEFSIASMLGMPNVGESKDLLRKDIVLRGCASALGASMADLVRDHYRSQTTTLEAGKVLYTASRWSRVTERSFGDRNRPGVLSNLELVPQGLVVTLNFDFAPSSDALTSKSAPEIHVAVVAVEPAYTDSHAGIVRTLIQEVLETDADVVVVTECSMTNGAAFALIGRLGEFTSRPNKVILAGSDYVDREAVMPVFAVAADGGVVVGRVVKNCPSVPATRGQLDEFPMFNRKFPNELTLFLAKNGRSFCVLMCSDLLHGDLVSALRILGVETVIAPCHSTGSGKRMVNSLAKSGVHQRILVNSDYSVDGQAGRWYVYINEVQEWDYLLPIGQIKSEIVGAQ
jgi:hypothetical protein